MSNPPAAGGGLDDSVLNLPGVGPARSTALREVGVATVSDLLRFFPLRYRVLPPVSDICDAVEGALVTFRGVVVGSKVRSSRRRGVGHLEIRLQDDTGLSVATFYNQGYLSTQLGEGVAVRISGEVRNVDPAEIHPVSWSLSSSAGDDRKERVECEYPRVKGVPPRLLSRLIAGSMEEARDSLRDPLPWSFLEDRGLLDLESAVGAAHAPPSIEMAVRAEERLLYDGFLASAIEAEFQRGRNDRNMPGLRVEVRIDAEMDRGIRDSFPFKLTRWQDAAIGEIVDAMNDDMPMRRLLQGDVGCGKTAIAGYIVRAMALSGGQVAVLTPTDALARQFHGVLAGWCSDSPPVLLVGDMGTREKRETISALAEGGARMVVGTHALLEDRVEFQGLSLVVVDEQHRFGVSQRLDLVRKGMSPHLLVMSATPIPRTLAMTLHSDLLVTRVHGKPPGRSAIQTEIAVSGGFDWSEIAARSMKEKTFVVFPAIEGAEGGPSSLLVEGREIAVRYFKNVAVGALHGRLPGQEKARILEDFRHGNVRVLFTTTVIEVGVDVPDASTIIIVDAPRFGLAQLHQLRGRVGRSSLPGRCVLLARSLAEAESSRLDVLVNTEDGFEIAERDLDLRGPGDIMGLRQHGLFPVAAGSGEEHLLTQAFEDARDILQLEATHENLVSSLRKWSRARPVSSREFLDAG